jgi:transaldolase / glucose-6-phosphate isomerase
VEHDGSAGQGSAGEGSARLPVLAGLAGLADRVAELERDARADHARLLDRDTALWPAAAEVTGAWLGWLASLERADGHLARIRPIVDELLAEGVTDVVLVGMGGSSLFPLVLEGVCGSVPGHPRLHVLDSTDPAAVARVEAEVDWTRTVVVAASKSGTTIETRAHLDRFRSLLDGAVGERSGRRVLVVTDPGSALEDLAHAAGFRAVIHGDADVGGRYSALSPFGLVPAVLLGLDVDRLLASARDAAARWASDPWSDVGPALLASLLAVAAADGRDALHLLVPAEAGMFGSWVEQLVAESSGKDGVGVLPVVCHDAHDVIAHDRAVVVALGAGPVSGAGGGALSTLAAQGVPVVVLPSPGPDGLAVEALRWMQAVPLLCAQLGVDPFDQPDVAAAKAATAQALASGTEPDAARPLDDLSAALGAAGYVALLGYVDPGGPDAVTLGAAARVLAARHRVPVTVGIGPRYLHSTGQLHKGGRDDGVFLVVVGDDPVDVAIPGRDHGFARLKRAQAAGDLVALRDAGRRAEHVTLDDLVRTVAAG